MPRVRRRRRIIGLKEIVPLLFIAEEADENDDRDRREALEIARF